MSLECGRARPKILFVTSHWPLAKAYGAQQRVLNISKLLSRFGDVSFVIAPGEAEDNATMLRTKEKFDICMVARPLPVKAGTLFAKLTHRVRHEFDPTYMSTDGYSVSKVDREGLQELIKQYDLIWVHSVRVANWFRIDRWPRSVLDVDDLYSSLYLSRAQSDGSPLRQLLNLRMSRIWRRRERRFLERFCFLTVCSEDDRDYLRQSLGRQERIRVIPNGCNPVTHRRCVSSDRPRIGFIGNCVFEPNAKGLEWFIREVWPVIKRKFPDAELRLVGRESHGYLTKLGPDIIGHGWLEDPGPEIASWSAMIVPIKLGAGTRVKVAEGFARKCPIVATTLGAFGYEADYGKEILLADHAQDFASACIQLLENPQFGEVLAEKAHKRFLERWQWESFEGTVANVVQDCLATENMRLISPLSDTLPGAVK
jgi:glycosyltransferase involved in cell wall biosynthesis